MLTRTLELPPETDAVPRGRRFVRQVLTSWELPELVDSALLLTSELLTNSVLHARTPIVLTVRRLPECVEVTISDESEVLPMRRRHAADSTTGRGLDLLDQLATDWEVVLDGPGKLVRFTLSEHVDAWGDFTKHDSAAEP